MAIPQALHATTSAKLLVTLGHESSEIIEEAGEGGMQLKVGGRVAVRPNLYDLTRPCCVLGRPDCCRNLGFIGYSGEFIVCCLIFLF
jgi:threonine dehydrogenase-like Zn-dependent dehydrogenase